jgi:hypothetical protein
VIFPAFYPNLQDMANITGGQERSGKFTSGVVSVAGLVLVWGIVWANLPSKEELLSAQSADQPPAKPPEVPELDLTIPGIPSGPQVTGRVEENSRGAASDGPPAFSNADPHARQVVEVKCDAEVQRYCPDSLTGEERRRCAARRVAQLPQACQQIVRERIVRWKEAEGYKLACRDDVKRYCQTVVPGEGRILQCLQEHEQELSDRCYQTLPKGRLLMHQ